MRTVTEMPVLMSLTKNEIAQLGQNETVEVLDVNLPAKKEKGISAGNMWRVHQQRRRLVLRQALR